MYLFLDTETTGLKAQVHDLLSLSMVLTDTKGKTLLVYDVFLKPNVEIDWVIDPIALQCNKINLVEHLKSAITYFKASDQLRSVYSEIHKTHTAGIKPTIVGHNVSFDLAFMAKHLGEDHRLYCHKYSEDTAVIASFLGYKFKNLADLAKQLGIDVIESSLHTAAYDRDLTKAVYFRLKDKVYGE